MSEFIAYCRFGLMVQPHKHSLVRNLAITLQLGQFVLNKLLRAQFIRPYKITSSISTILGSLIITNWGRLLDLVKTCWLSKGSYI